MNKKTENKEMASDFPEADQWLVWSRCMPGHPWLLCAIKNYKMSIIEFYVHSMCWQ
jgi:hypothetical protein